MEPWYKVATPRKEVREGRSFNPDEFAIALEVEHDIRRTPAGALWRSRGPTAASPTRSSSWPGSTGWSIWPMRGGWGRGPCAFAPGARRPRAGEAQAPHG